MGRGATKSSVHTNRGGLAPAPPQVRQNQPAFSLPSAPEVRLSSPRSLYRRRKKLGTSRSLASYFLDSSTRGCCGAIGAGATDVQAAGTLRRAARDGGRDDGDLHFAAHPLVDHRAEDDVRLGIGRRVD